MLGLRACSEVPGSYSDSLSSLRVGTRSRPKERLRSARASAPPRCRIQTPPRVRVSGPARMRRTGRRRIHGRQQPRMTAEASTRPMARPTARQPSTSTASSRTTPWWRSTPTTPSIATRTAPGSSSMALWGRSTGAPRWKASRTKPPGMRCGSPFGQPRHRARQPAGWIRERCRVVDSHHAGRLTFAPRASFFPVHDCASSSLGA